jgi:predicted HTH transcriptional regulator
MKLKLDFNRDGYLFPHNRIEKLFALAGYLFEKNSRSLQTLCRNLEKSEEQMRRDLKELAKFYEVKWDQKNNPYIASPELKQKNEYHTLIEVLQGEPRYSLEELAAQFNVHARTMRRHLKTIEKFFDLDYDLQDRPFIFSK